MTIYLDLSHRITQGMETYPGLPTPEIGTHLSREAAEELYGPGVRFHIGLLTMCTNTGTYLDVPFHRYDDGHDLAALPLERVADVPGLCIEAGGSTAIDLAAVELAEASGAAVLIHTGHARHWGTPAYGENHPYLTAAAAEALVAAEVACVGIDSLNIDSTTDSARPVHSILLRAGIPIVEHLTRLDRLPPRGFRFTAVPPPIEGAGTFTVRALAMV
ncbi:MAG: cyclase family protein [Actinomycetota bacterium]